MQLDRMAFPLIFPIFTHPQIPSTQQKIDFNTVLQSYIQLLAGSGGSLFFATYAIANICQRALLATQIVFYRLLHAPTFDPTSSVFKEQIDQLEKQVPILQEEIEQLEQKFWQNHLIGRDMQRLRQLHNDISKPLYRLNRYVSILEQRQHRFPIQDQLDRVRDLFQQLDEQLDDYCLNKGESIVDQFKTAVNVFTHGNVELPKDVCQQLVDTWKALEESMKRLRHHLHTPEAQTVCSKISDLREMMLGLEKQAGVETSPTNFERPLKLRNIGNSCYLDSVLQAMLCIEGLRDQFREPLVRDPAKPDEHPKKIAIQQELLQFIDSQPQNRNGDKGLTQMEFILLLLGGPSLVRLREAIFKSGLHYEFSMPNLTRQLDAASVVELFVDGFLPNCKFKWQQHSSAPVFPGFEFEGPVDKQTVLQVPLRSLARFHKLDKLVQTVLGLHVEREKDPTYQRTFDPKDGKVIKGKERQAATVAAAAATKVDEFHSSYKLTELSPVMVIHFKRFLNQIQTGQTTQSARLVKDTRPVILPQDGILDLTDYYEAPEDGPQQARYKIKSMVIHSGGLHGGHYIALVEINGKYYQCDDLDPKGYREITKRQFVSHKDPYMLFLERLPDEEEAPPKA
jgi:ubiquitin C-terminal hydrolase